MTYYVQRAGDEALKQALYKNLNAMFWEAFASDDEVENAYQDLVDEYRSQTKTEVYPFMEPPDGMKEWLGERPTTKIVDRVFSVDNKKFAQGVKIMLDDARDNRLGVYRDPIMNLAAEARTIWNERLAAALEGGTTTLWLPDNQYYFDTDHAVNADDSTLGTYSNNFDNTAQGGSAACPLTYANVLAKYKLGLTRKMPNNRPMRIRYDTIVVPSALEDVAMDLVTKNFIAPVASTSIEANNILQESSLRRLALRVKVLPQLADSDTWFLGAFMRKGARPCGLQIREDIRFQRVGPVSTPDVEADGGDDIVSDAEYHHDVVEMGPRCRGDAFLKWPWRLIRCKG